MKLYLILYHSKFNQEWSCDSTNPTRELAEAKLAYERLKQPTWRFELVEVEIPGKMEIVA